MKPIRFSCRETLQLAPEVIAQKMLEVANWAEFQGYGFLPGIKTAEFGLRTPQIVGSRIRVINTDGSSHVEQIVEWQPDRRLVLHFQEFSPPVSRLASAFDEIWDFERRGNVTNVTRSFELHPKSTAAWP